MGAVVIADPRAGWWAEDTRLKEAIDAAREAGDARLVETLKQERAAWLQYQPVVRP